MPFPAASTAARRSFLAQVVVLCSFALFLLAFRIAPHTDAVGPSQAALRAPPADNPGQDESPAAEVTPDHALSLGLPAAGPPAFARDILFIKVPKAGGTTLAVMLQRYARKFQLAVADPGRSPKTWLVDTCQLDPAKRLEQWQRMLQVNDNAALQVFASHSCAAEFMFAPKFWSQERRPLALTLIRNPWDTLVSEFRYLRKCCMKHESSPDTAKATWCLKQCHIATLAQFVEACAKPLATKCSSQFRYVAGDTRRAPLDRYGLVLTLDRLDEGLALLHVLHGFPFSVLPYITTNSNKAVALPNATDSFKRHVAKDLLAVDFALYDEANARLDRAVAKLGAESRERFERTLVRLRAANRAASKLCASRRGEDCLASARTGALYAGACFSDCVEAVAAGETDPRRLPKVRACERCPRFKINCQECACLGDGGATCIESLVCETRDGAVCLE